MAAIATAVTIFLFLSNLPQPIFILIFLLPMWGVVQSSALVLCTPVLMSYRYRPACFFSVFIALQGQIYIGGWGGGGGGGLSLHA